MKKLWSTIPTSVWKKAETFADAVDEEADVNVLLFPLLQQDGDDVCFVDVPVGIGELLDVQSQHFQADGRQPDTFHHVYRLVKELLFVPVTGDRIKNDQRTLLMSARKASI